VLKTTLINEVKMIVGNYNLHQILFALDTFKGVDEKIGYLAKIRHELNRIVLCFETPQTLPLKMYASQNINLEGTCDELMNFVSHQFEVISSNPYDKRYPGEGELRGLVRTELINYQKLLTIIDDEINSIKSVKPKSEIHTVNNSKKEKFTTKKKFIRVEKYSPHFISKILNELTGQKIIWNSSIGELIDFVKIMIILDLVSELEEGNLSQYISKNFVNERKEKYTIPQIEKVHKMLQNTFWLNGRRQSPKYFQ